MKNRKLYIILGLGLAFTSCLKTEFDPLERTQGDANFKHYVSVGNSLTQGYQDGGLHNENGQQQNSYPAMIARQMALVNPDMDEFIQPLVSGHGSGHLVLGFENGELGVVGQGDPGGEGEDPFWSSWGDKTIKYNNLGVSGIAVWQIAADGFTEEVLNHAILSGVSLYNNGEPLNPFARFLDFGEDPTNVLGGGETYDYVHHIEVSEATFFTNWLGNNDVLGWSLAGGDEGEISIAGIGLLKTSPLTEVAEFREKYNAVLMAFSNLGAKGICATLPDVTAIPMFTTIDEEFLGVDELWITEGVSGNIRLKTENDLVLLYGADAIDAGAGSSQSNPIPHEYVLDIQEVSTVQQRTTELNAVIRDLAMQYDFGLVDMHEYLEGFKTGFSEAGVDLSAKFIEGGVFSLDGVHPNTKGYAIVANKFIEAINEKYGASVPRIDVNQFKGIEFPNE